MLLAPSALRCLTVRAVVEHFAPFNPPPLVPHHGPPQPIAMLTRWRSLRFSSLARVTCLPSVGARHARQPQVESQPSIRPPVAQDTAQSWNGRFVLATGVGLKGAGISGKHDEASTGATAGSEARGSIDAEGVYRQPRTARTAVRGFRWTSGPTLISKISDFRRQRVARPEMPGAFKLSISVLPSIMTSAAIPSPTVRRESAASSWIRLRRVRAPW